MRPSLLRALDRMDQEDGCGENPPYIFDMRINKRIAVYFCAHVQSTTVDWWRVA